MTDIRSVEEESDFNELAVTYLEILGQRIYKNAVDHGFWDKERNDGEMIALMHSELSEALEGLRHGNPLSEHIPEFTAVEEEFADLVIRLLDMCHGRNIRLADAIVAKMKFNEGRPHMHGKKF